MDYLKEISNYIEKEIEVLKNLDISSIDKCINEILLAYKRDGKIYIFGNGGSAATASHYANDFNKGISEYVEKKFLFECLNDNVPTIMAIANDIGYEEIFRFQLKGRVKKQDLVIGLSGSGNSKNIINALHYAKENNIRTIGITGYDGGEVKNIVDLNLNVKINSMQITEDIHMVFDHLMMSVLFTILNIKK